MDFVTAVKIAIRDHKLIALPHDDQCQDNGLRLKLGILNGQFVCYEFYGIERTFQVFSLKPSEITRNDWFIV